MNKVIVTGGAGFIGSHLTDALIKKGYEVHVIDNLSGSTGEFINKKATHHNVDIRNFNDIAPIFQGARYVFHLAAIPRVPFSIEQPVLTNDVNINGSLNVLLAARDANVEKVVYSASSSAYGDQPTLPQQEEMRPSPKSPYGLQKYVIEHYARIFSEVYKLPTVSLRYFNVFGPRQNPNGPYAGVLVKFLQLKKEGKVLPIVGDGMQTRDFTSVHDVVRANIMAAEKDTVGKGEVINIGGGKNYSIKQIAEMVGGPVEYTPARVEAKDSLADITRAKGLLGWQPEITLEQGIAELKEYMQTV